LITKEKGNIEKSMFLKNDASEKWNRRYQITISNVVKQVLVFRSTVFLLISMQFVIINTEQHKYPVALLAAFFVNRR
jgi:hypothetical protein